MSNGDFVLTALKSVYAASGKGKEDRLRELVKDSLRGRYITLSAAYALDPFKTYGIDGKLDDVRMPMGSQDLGPDTFELLDKLAERQITGHSALHALAALDLDAESWEVVKRIIRKDLRCGAGAKTFNKVFPNLIPEFGCMLAHKFEPARLKKWPVVVEPKLDGIRVLVILRGDGTAECLSRTGKPLPALDHLTDTFLRYEGVARDVGKMPEPIVLDGEIISGSFNDTVSSVRKKSEMAADAVYHLFDLIPLNVLSGAITSPIYSSRRTLLTAIQQEWDKHVGNPQISLVKSYWANSESEIDHYYAVFQARGLEGLIIKDPHASYQPKRSHAWMKMKSEETLDAPIVGRFEGTGKYVGKLGGLIVNFDGTNVSVGGGFTDAERDALWSVDFDGELSGRLVEVAYQNVTEDKSLRHPRFVRFRDLAEHPGDKL